MIYVNNSNLLPILRINVNIYSNYEKQHANKEQIIGQNKELRRMPKLRKRKTKTGVTYSITIPKEIIEVMGWKDKDTILCTVLDEKSVEFKKIDVKKG